MTPAERENMLKELDQTRDEFLHAVEGMSEEQLEYREAPGRWSVAEIIEHVTVAEHGILGWIENALRSAPDSAKRGDWDGQDEPLRNKFEESRKIRLQAPEVAWPTGRWPLAQLLPEFTAARQHTREFAAATKDDLRSRSVRHFQFGLLDCYQWLVCIGSHCDRHRAQIEKVKASAGFPR
jgi:uncharacterized damage-inducible protein DinB